MRYFLAFLATILLVLLLVVLLFGGGKPKVALSGKTLDSYASTDAAVQLTIDGPINAAQNHGQVRITIDSSNVNYEELQGYDGNVVNTQVFANSENAYVNFLFALEHAGFTKGNTDPALKDERGYCSRGDRYVFELKQDGTDIERYWATSCGNPKNYLGSVGLTLSLFEAQVPNYEQLSQHIVFST